MLSTIVRDLGHTHLVELLETAKRARKDATSAAQDLRAVAGAAAALDGTGEANGAVGERVDQKRICWLCHSPGLADQLRKCSGCHKVRLFTSTSILAESAQIYIVWCLRDSGALNSSEILLGTLLR